MAKTATTKKASTSAPAKKASVPARVEQKSLTTAEDADFLAQHAGAGTSQAAEDNVIPLVYLLQLNSPVVNKRGDNYVEGAEPGFIWLRGTKTVFNGEEGVYAQPCHFSKQWVEWGPKRGDGFKASHVTRPKEAVETEVIEEGKPRKKWIMPNGNVVVETRNHAVRLFTRDGEDFTCIGRFMISMNGTNHTSSRNWMMLMNGHVIPANGTPRVAPSFGFMYLLKTKHRKNNDGEWFMWEASEDEYCNQLLPRHELEEGLKMFTAFNTGALRGDNPDDVVNDESSEDDSNM